ncbi:MAG: CinA family protein [Clostridiales bacterium]
MEQQIRVVQKLIEKNLQVATAESCTGGMLSAAITDAPGSSQIFGCGVVSYSNQIKEQLLGVDGVVLAEYGAVSAQVAKAMAQGLQSLSGADICVAITGIAGPAGGSVEKPVGLVYIGVADRRGVNVYEQHFSGNRQKIRKMTVARALDLIEEAIAQS